MLEATFEKALDKWREYATNAYDLRIRLQRSIVRSVRSLATSGRMQGIAGGTFRRLRLSLEPLRAERCGSITWGDRPIGTTTVLQAVSAQSDVPICIGAGMMVACCLGVMMQQDFLDLHKLHVMGIQPTRLALHLCNPPDTADTVLVITRPNKVFTTDGYSCNNPLYSITGNSAQSSILALFMKQSVDRLKGTQIATGSTVSCMKIGDCSDTISHVARHREFVYSAGTRSTDNKGDLAWFTYAYVERLWRGSIPDQCMDALNCAVCSNIISSDLRLGPDCHPSHVG